MSENHAADNHRQCDPAECIHRAQLDVEPQVRTFHQEVARGRQEKEAYLRKHPSEARADQEMSEDEYYIEKRRNRQRVQHEADLKAQATTFGSYASPSVQVAFDGAYMGESPDMYETAEGERREKVQRLEVELLKAREDQVAHGDPMPLQDVRNVVGDALRLLESKNVSYRDAWRKQGYMGNLSRVQSKAERLKSMLWRDADGDGYPLPANYTRDGETIVDTLLDLINLSAFTVVNWTEENRWGGGK